MTYPTSYADLSRRVAERSIEHVEGIPAIVEGFALQTEENYRNRASFERLYDRREMPLRTCTTRDVDDTLIVRNVWWSRVRDGRTYLYEQNGKVRLLVERRPPASQRMGMMLATAAVASQAWDLDAEVRAQERLRRMVKPHLFEGYMMSGGLIESSTRSGVTYLIRRSRPCIAMVPDDRTRPGFEDRSMRFLAALCMHPIAYYRETWAGAMVPTDEVIAFLLHIRGDEPLLWRRANQHPVWAPEAGL